jgi:hypothetical protein
MSLGRANDPMLASPDFGYRFEKGNRNLMSVLNDLLNTGLMGEPQRLDYVIREHERLQRRVSDLEELLKSKGIISDEERTRLAGLPAAASESGA